MSHLVDADRLEQLAHDNPGTQIEAEYEDGREVRRWLRVGGRTYVAVVGRKPVSLADVKRAVRP